MDILTPVIKGLAIGTVLGVIAHVGSNTNASTGRRNVEYGKTADTLQSSPTLIDCVGTFGLFGITVGMVVGLGAWCDLQV